MSTPNSVLLGMTDKELTDYCHNTDLSNDPLIAEFAKRLDAALQAINDAASNVNEQVDAALYGAVKKELAHNYQYDKDIFALVKEHLIDWDWISADDGNELLRDIDRHRVSEPKIKRRPTPTRSHDACKPGPKSNTLQAIPAILRKARGAMKLADLVTKVMTGAKIGQSAAYKAIAQAEKAGVIRDSGNRQYKAVRISPILQLKKCR